MAKVNIKSEKLLLSEDFITLARLFMRFINGTLGVRSSTYNDYQQDEIMSDVFLCGGDCVEIVYT